MGSSLLRSIVLLPILLAAIPLAAADGEPRTLAVPEGRHVLTDGVFDAGEWNDAAALPLGDVELLAKRDPRYLYLALRFADGKHSGLDLYLAGDSGARRMFHSSSELGVKRREPDGWSEYDWNVRGWVANPVGIVRGTETLVIHEPDGFELQLAREMLAAEGLGGSEIRLAFRLKRPEVTVPEGAEAAEPEEWIVLDLAAFDSPDLAAAEPDPAQALRQAASDGDRAEVARLLASGVDVNEASSSGGTALMFAAYGDHAEIVEDLLKAGAEPDVGDRFGDPATHWAAYGGAAAAVDSLLDGGADPKVVTHHGDALAIAMRRGFPAIVETVSRHTGTGTGETPLHVAARGDDAAEIDRLLVDGAKVDAENRIGYTPLMEAAREGHVETVKRLLAAGADPAHTGNALGMGMTALHLAADRDRPEVARLLLSRGVPVDVANAQRTTPLAWALGEGSTETALVLLDAGADPARKDENDFSALDMVEYLEDEELRRRIREAADR